MTDEEFVRTFLNKNYVVSLFEKGFVIKDIDLEEYYNVQPFNGLIKKLLGSDEIFSTILNSWYTENSEKLITNLTDFFKSIPKEIKSREGFFQVIKFCQENKFVSVTFAHTLYTKFYVENFDTTLFENLKNSVNLGVQTSADMEILLRPKLYNETEGVANEIIGNLNTWYFDNVMSGRLKTFLERSKVILGQTDWTIKNLDYGSFSSSDILSCFSEENVFQRTIIKRVILEWFENQRYIVSEQMMKNMY